MAAPISAKREFTVTEDDTAVTLGSGALPVLGTPRLVAWCEAVTCTSMQGALEDSQTSVGTRIQLDHVGASPVGATLIVAATPTYADGRLHRFEVVATQLLGSGPHAEEKVVGHGEITRVVVDVERFMSRVR